MIEFKGSHFERAVILWAVRWYVAYPISYRQLEEMMEEHGVEVDHATLNRWVLKYVPLLDQVSSAQAPGGSQLGNGRDLCEGQGHLEVFVSGRR
jgi:transposase-like protein